MMRPDKDPHTGRPWSSRSLAECLRVGAERFGWHQRDPVLRSMRAGDQLIGWGVASATYPVFRMPVQARVLLLADVSALVQCGTQDIGTGTATVLAQIAADELHLPISDVRVELGNSDLPPGPPSVGSMTAAMVVPAVRSAAAEVHRQIMHAGGSELSEGRSQRELYAAGLRYLGRATFEHTALAEPGDDAKNYAMQAFGAHFVEVHVDDLLGEVRVKRVVGVYAAGRILNPKLARSQVIGGIVFAIGLALFEATSFDTRLGRVVGTTLGDYHLPVWADVPHIDVHFVDERDQSADGMGAKGIGMLGHVGIAPAIASAVYHATGRRVCDLPITPDKLL